MAYKIDIEHLVRIRLCSSAPINIPLLINMEFLMLFVCMLARENSLYSCIVLTHLLFSLHN